MSNFNRVLLMGRLTKDPELRYTPKGTAVSDIGLAINREFTAGTERRKETTFVDVTFWSRQAELICEYLRKGSPLFVEGRLALDTWETQDGQKRSRLRVVAENFQFLGGRSGGGEGEEGGGDYGQSYRRDAEGGGGGSEGGSSPQFRSGGRSRGASYGAPGRAAAGGASPAPSTEEAMENVEEAAPADESDIPF